MKRFRQWQKLMKKNLIFSELKLSKCKLKEKMFLVTVSTFLWHYPPMFENGKSTAQEKFNLGPSDNVIKQKLQPRAHYVTILFWKFICWWRERLSSMLYSEIRPFAAIWSTLTFEEKKCMPSSYQNRIPFNVRRALKPQIFMIDRKVRFVPVMATSQHSNRSRRTSLLLVQSRLFLSSNPISQVHLLSGSPCVSWQREESKV